MDIFGNFPKFKGDRDSRKVRRKKELDFSYSDTMIEGVGKVETKSSFFSTFSLKGFVVVIFCILVLRIFTIQVIQGSANADQAEMNRTRPRIIEATRGLILDSNGDWLARNEADFSLAVYPSELPKLKKDREATYRQMATISGLSFDEIKSESEKNGLSTLDMVVLKENISHDDALLLEQKINGIHGFFVADQTSRQYLVLPGLAHILGYTSKVDVKDIASHPTGYFLSDRIGKTGLESQYEADLKGTNGVEEVEVNSKGNITQNLTQGESKQPVAGDNITLYLDKGLQTEAGLALKNGIETAKQLTGDTTINSGVAMVMDVNTGGILADVSLPDYDNNLFATKISNDDYQKLINDPNKPMFNRAIQGTYPPGSISKIILAAGGLMEGIITKDTSMVTPAAIKIGTYVFPDWKDHSYESTNIERAIAESNDVFFYSLGGGFDKIKGMGMTLISKWWNLFGLGEKTGIDLPGESSGFLPTPDWKKQARGESWYIGDTYHVSIGQGDLLVTPIQMLRATAAIANGGKLLQPQFVQKITSAAGKLIQQFGPRIERENYVSPDVLKTVQEGMRMTVTDGSARNLNDLPVAVAGKTGTAQFLDNQKTHAWFVSYAPYDKPQIAVIVFVDGGGEGYDVAAPVAKDIINYYFTR